MANHGVLSGGAAAELLSNPTRLNMFYNEPKGNSVHLKVTKVLLVALKASLYIFAIRTL